MKKNNYATALFLPILLILFIATLSFTSGSPGGKTGSPGDGSSCLQCHSGTSIPISGWITSNIPNDGYSEDSTYTITVNATHAGVSLFGFEITAEDNSSDKVGEFIATDATQNQTMNNSTTLTHTTGGTSPNGDTKIWTFDWIAPMTNVGEIVFYAAINAANGNGDSQGDQIYLTSNAVQYNDITVDIKENDINNVISIYPNPVSDILNINLAQPSIINIYTVNGNVVYSQIISAEMTTIDISNYSPGIYFVKAGNITTKLIKK